jgi:hypothetical protein
MGTPKSHRSQALKAMQRNKRMARTLGCLVASMTLGAALLDWAHPNNRLPAATTGTELMSFIQGTSPALWRSIQLDPQSPDDRITPSHFIISRDGRAYPTSRWQSQEPAGGEGIVRIHLVSAEKSNEVTREQLHKAGELVRALQRECSIADELVHYDMLALGSESDPTAQ